MEDSNSNISLKDYQDFKSGKKSLKLKEIFHEITLVVIKTLLEELEEKGYDLNVLKENDDYLRLLIVAKTKYKTIEDYVNLAMPLIISKKN